MNLTAAWQTRRSGPAGPELEQAMVRLVMALMVSLYVFWYVSRKGYTGENGWNVLTTLAGWLVLSLGILASIWVWPSASVARRMLGILADVGAITFGLFVMGEAGAVLVGTYLFFIIGKGFRYGRLYLHVAQLFSLSGFVLAMFIVPWWQHEPSAGLSWMFSMLVLPFYVSVLTERVNAARVRAEEALKECVERQRSAP